MSLNRKQVRRLILEELEASNPTPHPGDGQEELNISSANVDRLREMKSDIDEMIDLLGPDVNEIIKLQLTELGREFETTIDAFEEI